MTVHLAHDLDADALYITVSDQPVARTICIDDCIMVDVDAAGHPVGIEVISPGRRLDDEADIRAALASKAEAGDDIPMEVLFDELGL